MIHYNKHASVSNPYDNENNPNDIVSILNMKGPALMKYNKEIFYQEYINREDSIMRAPYNPELEFYSIIQSGDTEHIKELCKSSPLKDKKGLGKLSSNPVNNIRYHFVITTALVARYCIEGGLDVATAYNLSDFYISKADTLKSVDDISELLAFMCIDYAK